jgi:hypothetical protein
MAINTENWLKRATEVLHQGPNPETVQFAGSITAAVYGVQSPQLAAFNNALAQIAKSTKAAREVMFFQGEHAIGAIRNVVAEIKQGLIGNLRALIAGEVFSELLSLGKETLEEGNDASKNVSSVLVAAAFEDLIRRMGSEMAGVPGRPKLESVVIALKDAQVLKGGEPGLAQSYLKFRNDSLHAHWENVQESQIQSCISFIETLLVKHFS